MRVDRLEWYLSTLTLALGFYITLFPESIGASHMRIISDIFSPIMLGVVFVAIGSTRIIILVYNPDVYYRLLLSVLTLLLWVEMEFDFAVRVVGYGVVPPGFLMLGWQLLGELDTSVRLARGR